MKLTLPQQDIYFEQLLYPGEPIYNIGAKIEVIGTLNIDVLKKAYDELINQHDAYRIALKKNGNEIILDIPETHNSTLGIIDFMDHNNPEAIAHTYMQKEFTTAFDIVTDNQLHKFTLIKVKENKYYLFSVYHHIITDGWGTSLMFQRWVQNYNEILEYGTVQTEYPYSYNDFVQDDLSYQNSKTYETDKSYWVEKFKDLPENLFEKITEEYQNKSKRNVLTLKRSLYNQLNELAVSTKTSTFHLILAALYLYFSRRNNNRDFAIGLPVLNRSKSTFKKTVGLFMGVTALRIQIDPNSTILDLVNTIKAQLRQDYRYQRFPLGKLIQELQLFNQKERLFNITLSYEKQNYKNDFIDTKTKVIPMTHQSERVALALYVREFDDTEDVHIDFDYNLSYFDESTIQDIASHFENLIHKIIEKPSEKIRAVDFLSPNEKETILKNFNQTKINYNQEKTFLDAFEKQAINAPDAMAIIDDSSSYTYASIHKLSGKIGTYINTEFTGQEKLPIAVMMNRSADMLAILLGIMKSGRAYIPLDPTFPKDRLEYILENSETKLLINDNINIPIGDPKKTHSISTTKIIKAAHNLDEIENSPTTPKDLAYIIYTSGSTGNPKGVKIAHRSLYNFLQSIQNTPGISPEDLLFSVTTYSFDISILEFFAPLLSGATVYIANNVTLSDPSATIKKIEEIKPSIIQGTPSFYQMLFNAGWQGSKQIKMMCGGDLLSESLAEKLIENSAELWNMYGPTECTIWSSIKKIEKPEHASNIGKPIYNTQFYILDEFLNPMPLKTLGNIYIGGAGLAVGYHKKSALTQEKFIPNPFNKQETIYETGDVGRWNEKGEIEFFGRNDNQVKIRGYRIELGDIETKINLIEGIRNTVVIAKKGAQQDDFLVAYIIAEDNRPTTDQIITRLKTELPEYMIPYTIIPLTEFPLTPNKKIDRKKLIQKEIRIEVSEGSIHTAQTTLEIQLENYWKEILLINEDIDIDQNFFSLGGNSLNAVKLINRIQEDLSFKISLKTIFDYSSIGTLAAFLETKEKNQVVTIPTAAIKDYYNLTPAQHTIWLASQQQHMSIAYNMAAAYHIIGDFDIDIIKTAINRSIQRHEILRTNFVELNGTPFQKINPSETSAIDISIQKLPENKIRSAVQDFANQEFDLETNSLIAVKLFQSEDNTYVLAFLTHHIIMDGWSMEILIQEITENYNHQISKTNNLEHTLPLQFKDYSEWYLKEIEKNKIQNQSFWSTYLEGVHHHQAFKPDNLNITGAPNGEEYVMELTDDVYLGIKKLAKEQKTTLHTLLITALNLLIHKTSDQNDICIGTVNSGRENTAFSANIGMFVKTLPLRSQITEELNFIELLKKTEENLLQVDTHQDLPQEYSQNAMYDVLLVYQNADFSYESINELNGVKLTSFEIKNQYSRFPISFNFMENNAKLKAIVNYNCEIYQSETIQIIAHQFTQLLEQIAIGSASKIKDINLVSLIEDTEAIDFDFNF